MWREEREGERERDTKEREVEQKKKIAEPSNFLICNNYCKLSKWSIR